MNFSEIIVEQTDDIAVITLNRPEKRNALSMNMMGEIISALKNIESEKKAKAVIIKGKGPAFSAGHDLSEMTNGDIGKYRDIFDRCSVMMTAIQSIPQPVIAQVHGIATAAGCQLVATCDLAIAEEGTRFATPGVKIGLFCSTPMVALSRAIGRKKALEMLLTGEYMNAKDAAAFGLINKAVSSEELEIATLKLAKKIAEASSLVVGIGKQAFYAQIDLTQSKAYKYTKEVMSLNAMAYDAKEGICAFLQKRKPKWKEK